MNILTVSTSVFISLFRKQNLCNISFCDALINCVRLNLNPRVHEVLKSQLFNLFSPIMLEWGGNMKDEPPWVFFLRLGIVVNKCCLQPPLHSGPQGTTSHMAGYRRTHRHQWHDLGTQYPLGSLGPHIRNSGIIKITYFGKLDDFMVTRPTLC